MRGQRLATGEHPAQRAGVRRGGLAQEHLQHGRHEVRGGDGLPGDQAGQVGGVLVAAGLGDHEGRPGQQRPEELPHRDVETARRLLQHPVPGPQAVLPLHPLQPVDDGPVRDQRALGAAGGTGSEDRVRRVVGQDHRPRRGIRRGERGVQPQHRRPRRLPAGAQHQRRGGVGHDPEVALLGLPGVDGQVGGPRLQHPAQGDHQVEGARYGDRDHALRSDAAGREHVRETARPLLQRPVGQGLPLEDDGGGVRGPGRLLREQRGQRRLREGGGGVVPLGQDPVALGRGQRVQHLQRRVRVGRPPLQQPHQPLAQLPHPAGADEPGVVAQPQPERRARLDHQGQREVRGVPEPDPRLKAEAGQVERVVAHREVLEDQVRVEEGGRGAGQPLDLRQTQVVVVHQLRPPALELRTDPAQRGGRVDPGPHGHGVDQHADHPLRARQFGGAAADRETEDHVVLAGGAGHERRPGALDHAGQQQPALPGPRGQRRRPLLVEPHHHVLGGGAGGDPAGAVRDPAGRVETGQGGAPGLLGGGPVAARQVRQVLPVGPYRLRLATRVQGEQLAEEQAERPAVQQNVMGRHQKSVPVVRQPQQREPQQRRAAAVDALRPVLLRQLRCPVRGRPGGQGAEVVLLPGRLHVPADHLDGIAVLAVGEDHSQVGVAAQQLPGGPAQPSRVERPVQVDGELGDVEVLGVLVVPGVEEHALLQRGEGQDVLDGRPAGVHG